MEQRLVNIRPTTEAEAVSAMFAATGEAFFDVTDSASPETVLAYNILRDTTREIQTRGWRFNSEIGYKLTPVGTVPGDGPGGVLNVFKVPSDLASFELTRTNIQRGMDVERRPSRVYKEDGKSVLVFYDRLNHADGLSLPVLQIDPIWFFDFEHMPEAARRAVTVLAARRFQTQTLGTEQATGFSEQDLALAMQLLEQDQLAPVHVVDASEGQTETDALNQMLVIAGLPPVASVESVGTTPAAIALNTLRSVARDVLGQGWSFNTEFGFEIAPEGSFTWRGRDGTQETLNVFVPPKDLLTFSLSRDGAQFGTYRNVVIRLSRKNVIPGGGAGLVFYDKDRNRDGLKLDFLYIDGVFWIPFNYLPDVAKRYIAVRATRQYLTGIGKVDQAGFTQRDELMALKELRRQEGMKDHYNVFNNPTVVAMLGGRSVGSYLTGDRRNSTGTI